MGGGGGGTVNTSNTETSKVSPAPWMEALSQALGGQGQNAWNQAMNQSNAIGANASNWANQGNSAMNQGLGVLGNATGMSQNAANLAAQSAVYDPNIMQQNFMNPYTANVVQQNADIAQRNFNQQTAPSLMAQMGSTGQFGSSRANNAMGLAASNMAGNLAQTNASLMNQGYQQQQNAYLQSMGIGVNAANAINGAAYSTATAGSGMGNIGNSLWNSAAGANGLAANNFSGFSGGLANLPISKQNQTQSNGTQPAQNSGWL